MFPVKKSGAILISRLRFVVAAISIFLFVTINPANPNDTAINIALLMGCMIAFYMLSSSVMKHMWLLYFGICCVLVVGIFAGIEMSFLSALILPAFVLSIKDEWNMKRVLLFSTPALIATVIMQNSATVCQFALSLCAIIFFGDSPENIDFEDDDEDDIKVLPQYFKNRGRLVYTVVLIIAAILIVRAAVHTYGSSVAPVLSITRVLSFILIHCVLHLSIHIYLLSGDNAIDGDSYSLFAPAAAISATSALILFCNTTAPWANMPFFVGMAMLLMRVFDLYEERLQSCSDSLPSEE